MRITFTEQLEQLHNEMISMGEMIEKAIIRAIDALDSGNVEKAKEVVKHDDVVDKLFIIAKNQLIETIREDTARASEAADLLMAAKYLERVGDHATNIAEWAIYSIN